MTPSRAARAAIVLIVAAWGFPPVASAVVGLHVAAHHHHEEPTAAGTFALAHGHEHDLQVPPHDHDATNPIGPTLSTTVAAADAVPSLLAAASGSVGELHSLASQQSHSPPSPTTPTPLRL